MSKGRVLVVDDEAGIRNLMTDVMSMADYEVTTVGDGIAALDQVRRNNFDIILLDINLPKMDGFTVLEKVREMAPTLPIVVLSARVDKQDVAYGLNLGADDYVRKPFSVEELVVRIENILRRFQKIEHRKLVCGPIELNEHEHRCLFNGENIELSPTEYALLSILMQHQNHVMTKEKLLDLVWNMDFATTSNVVDTYISYLRKKLHKDGYEGIKTVRGIGFKLEAQ